VTLTIAELRERGLVRACARHLAEKPFFGHRYGCLQCVEATIEVCIRETIGCASDGAESVLAMHPDGIDVSDAHDNCLSCRVHKKAKRFALARFGLEETP